MSAPARTRYRPGLADVTRREWYLTRLDWGLRDLPSKESRHIRRDLRRDITATAAEVGMRPALDDLGTPGDLATQYTAGMDPEGPRYVQGALAAGATVAAIVFLLVAYAVGTLDTLSFVGGGTRTLSLWGSETVLTATPEVTSVQIMNAISMVLVIAAISAVAFLVFSRIWRIGRKSR